LVAALAVRVDSRPLRQYNEASSEMMRLFCMR